jgi:hypothetical protein
MICWPGFLLDAMMALVMITISIMVTVTVLSIQAIKDSDDDESNELAKLVLVSSHMAVILMPFGMA